MLKTSLKKFFRLLPLLAYSILVFYISSRPFPKSSNIPHMDKVVHFIIYGLLSVLILYALKNKRWIFAGLVSGFYGILNEIHQLYVPGRSFSIGDIVFNFLGAFILAFIFIKGKNKFSAKEI